VRPVAAATTPEHRGISACPSSRQSGTGNWHWTDLRRLVNANVPVLDGLPYFLVFSHYLLNTFDVPTKGSATIAQTLTSSPFFFL